MRALIVYESMFGNTRAIAEAIAKGIGSDSAVSVVGVNDVEGRMLEGIDLLVVGAPTHAHGMSRPSTRKNAAEMVSKPGSWLKLERFALGKGVREWLDSVGPMRLHVAAFDTRIKGPAWMMGSAAKGIVKKLRRYGVRTIGKPTSFFVTKDNHLRPGEELRATAWGQELGEVLAEVSDRARR